MRDFLAEFVNRKADQGARSVPGTFRKLAREARAYVAEVTEKHPMDPPAGFELDLETGEMALRFESGETRTLPVQVVGTYADDGTFMWGWGHPSVPQPLQQAAWAAQRYGDRQEIAELLTRGGRATKKQVRDYVAIAAYLAHADGVFTADHGGGGSVCVVWFLPENNKPYR